MKVTFDTLNENEVAEVLSLLNGNSAESNTVKAEEPKTRKTTPTKPKEEKATEEPKKAPTKKPEKEEPKSSISLADLKDSAKNAVGRTSREDVKKTIAEFAEKLAEVGKADYGKLYKKLQELGV